MAMAHFDFEKPIIELEQKLEDLQSKEHTDLHKIKQLEQHILAKKKEIYTNLTPWERVQLARHIQRPHTLDYVAILFENFTEVHGDRAYSDDPAVVCGFGHFQGEPVPVIGQQKGKDTKENLARNFGMMHPEGYRKAMRVMKLAEKFQIPIVIFIDTPGAYPGIGAEERGQGEAIARNIKDMYLLKSPIICIIIGEGASGGALGIGLGDVVLMLENAWYCVISPEGCASILWRDRAMAPRSADALKLTAPDLIELKIIEEIIPEPLGGAHRDPEQAALNVKAAVVKYLTRLRAKSTDQLLQERFQKYRVMGEYLEEKADSESSRPS